jgi:hypothetical protein
MTLLRLLANTTTAARTTAKPAPNPIKRTGITISHWPDEDVVLPAVVVEFVLVSVLVMVVEVVLDATAVAII